MRLMIALSGSTEQLRPRRTNSLIGAHRIDLEGGLDGAAERLGAGIDELADLLRPARQDEVVLENLGEADRPAFGTGTGGDRLDEVQELVDQRLADQLGVVRRLEGQRQIDAIGFEPIDKLAVEPLEDGEAHRRMVLLDTLGQRRGDQQGCGLGHADGDQAAPCAGEIDHVLMHAVELPQRLSQRSRRAGPGASLLPSG